ncbi:MAG: hypothetical protein QMC78_03815 [Methanocellales archaeon]|nr:hypothetical protein [Methanocellales archaeon]
MRNMYVKFPNAKTVAMITYKRNDFGKLFNPIFKDCTCSSFFFSFTNLSGTMAVNATIPAIMRIFLIASSGILVEEKYRKKIRASIEPRIAPLVSMALWMPNALPLLASESAIIASLGAVLSPLSTRSNGLSTSTCCHVAESARSVFDTADTT